MSARAQALYEDHVGPLISELVELEFFSALSLRVRMTDIARPVAEEVGRLFLGHAQSGLYARVRLGR